MDTHDFTMQKTRHPYHASNGRVHARRVPAGGKHSYFFHSFSFDKDGCQLSAVSRQLSVTSYQLSVIRFHYQLSDFRSIRFFRPNIIFRISSVRLNKLYISA